MPVLPPSESYWHVLSIQSTSERKQRNDTHGIILLVPTSMSLNKQPTIGIVSWDFEHPKGGLGRAMMRMRDVLTKNGCQVAAFTPSVLPMPLRQLAMRGGPIVFSVILPFLLPSFLRHHQVDLVLFPCGPGGVFFRFLREKQSIAICYHTYTQQSRLVPGQRWKRVFEGIERWQLAHATRVFCFAPETVDVVRRLTTKAHLVLLPQLLDSDAWTATKEKQRGLCVCVARLEARKGVETVLRVWPKVEARIPDARLIVVGDGHLRGTVDELIRTCKRASRLSSLSLAELIDLVGRSEIALCPAYLEGFGLAAAEAMCTKTAVIASATDGLCSLLEHGQAGVLVPAGDCDAWSSAIADLLLDHDRRRGLADTAYQSVHRRFDPAAAESAFVAAVREVIKGSS